MKNSICLKWAATMTILFSTLQVFAVDTSGCRVGVQTQYGQSNHGANLIIQKRTSSRANCWNAADDSVTLTYEWRQMTSEKHEVNFWTNVNGNQALRTANVTCESLRPAGMSAEKMEPTVDACRAVLSITTGYQPSLHVELAPQLDGQWDTQGFAQNYQFQF